jgi:hypothetical protein
MDGTLVYSGLMECPDGRLAGTGRRRRVTFTEV